VDVRGVILNEFPHLGGTIASPTWLACACLVFVCVSCARGCVHMHVMERKHAYKRVWVGFGVHMGV
jgi:hypothetical protein